MSKIWWILTPVLRIPILHFQLPWCQSFVVRTLSNSIYHNHMHERIHDKYVMLRNTGPGADGSNDFTELSSIGGEFYSTGTIVQTDSFGQYENDIIPITPEIGQNEVNISPIESDTNLELTINHEDIHYTNTIRQNITLEAIHIQQDTAYGRRQTQQWDVTKQDTQLIMSRRDWIVKGGAFVFGTTLVAGAVIRHQIDELTAIPPVTTKKLAPLNLTQVARETDVKITMECNRSCIVLDRTTFQKKRIIKLPSWVPQQFIPPPMVVKDIPTSELLIAAIFAGSTVEVARTILLYPLQTLKTRIQSEIQQQPQPIDYNNVNNKERQNDPLFIKKRLHLLQSNAVKHIQEGNLYAGIIPAVLVSVPATGLYYGVRDVTKRMLVAMPGLSDISIAVSAAFVADVVSLMFRTPADTLAMRLQAAAAQTETKPTDEYESDEDVAMNIADALVDAKIEKQVGNWLIESIERLPTVIATDLPYLLSRIVLNNLMLQGKVTDIVHYEQITVLTALLCAFLTTPFDVARTRILVNSGGNNELGSGSRGKNIFQVFNVIVQEGGVTNLFAGWLERTFYLGIAGAWLPFGLVLYNAIRDYILLEWFD